MAIRYYDKAISDKIKDWVKDPNMRILKPSESSRLFQMLADENNDQRLKLPIIAISRDSNVELIRTTSSAMTFDGAQLETKEKNTLTLNAIPIKITYQLDIYTEKFAEADEYMRNFVFNIINYPKISVWLPYNNANIEHYSTMHLQPSISDNSDIPERLISGQFTRMTLTIEVDDAYLYSIPFMKTWEMDEDVAIKEKGEA